MANKIDIFKAISLCNYNITIQKNFIDFLQSNFSYPSSNLYLFSRSTKAPKLFLLKTQVPGVHKGRNYNVSVLFYFPNDFPFVPPQAYLEKVGSIKINPQCTFYIQEDNLKINYELFFQWENNFFSLKNLIEELKHQFSFAFPIFNLPDTDNQNVAGDCILNPASLVEIELKKPIPPSPPPANNLTATNHSSNNIHHRNTIGISSQSQRNLATYDNSNTNNFQQNNQDSLNSTNFYQKGHNRVKSSEIQSSPTPQNPQYSQNIQNINSIYNPSQNLYSQNPYNTQVIKKPKDKPREPINEEEAKRHLIKQIILKTKHKVESQISQVLEVNFLLEKIKANIQTNIKKIERIDSKKEELKSVVGTLEKDLDIYLAPPAENIDLTDMSKLEDIVEIPNKEFINSLGKEETVEELLKIIKKAFERETINFDTAVKQIRINSRNLFFLKYKNMRDFSNYK